MNNKIKKYWKNEFFTINKLKIFILIVIITIISFIKQIFLLTFILLYICYIKKRKFFVIQHDKCTYVKEEIIKINLEDLNKNLKVPFSRLHVHENMVDIYVYRCMKCKSFTKTTKKCNVCDSWIILIK